MLNLVNDLIHDLTVCMAQRLVCLRGPQRIAALSVPGANVPAGPVAYSFESPDFLANFSLRDEFRGGFEGGGDVVDLGFADWA